MTGKNRQLQTRLENFITRCVHLANRLLPTQSNLRIIPQFIDSSTSWGANYQEACEAESAKDFVHKMKIGKKEGRETNYWLRMIDRTNKVEKLEIEALSKESEELIKIFSSIVSKFSLPKRPH